MSMPAWMYKLEEAQFKMNNNKEMMIDYLLTSPHAKEIPAANKKALLERYGYVAPDVEPKRKPGRPRKENM